jgi:peptidyl-prolyl cis-trans isomerase SurA
MHTLMLVTLLACGEEAAPGASPEAAPAPPPAAAPAQEAAPPTPTAVAMPEPPADDGPRDVPAGAPERISARHLVIAYKDSAAADPALRRTRAEARAQAEAALARAQAGEPLEDLARELSDGPSAPRGGDLGAFAQGVMDPRFEAAAFRLEVGQLSGIVETPFGFHIIERTALDEVRVSHVLVQHVEARRTTSERTKVEARTRAEEARARLLAGEPVAAVAKDLSDGPSGLRGGDLGWFQKGQLLPQFEDAAWQMKRGGVSDIIETPIGYHVLVRTD